MLKKVSSVKIIILLGLNKSKIIHLREYLKYNHGVINLDISYFSKDTYSHDEIYRKLLDLLNCSDNKILLENIEDKELIEFLKNNFKDALKVIYVSDGNNLNCNYDVKIKGNCTMTDLFISIDEIITDNFVYKGRCKLPNDFNIPFAYKNSINDIYNSLIRMKENILMLLVTGSCAREKINSNQSDIDLILVLKSNNIEDIENIKCILNKSEIKVGYTVFNKREFESLNVDYKTCFAIDQIKKECYIPTIYSPELKIPDIPYGKLVTLYKPQGASEVHQIRRILCDKKLECSETLFKQLFHFMRSYLYNEDKFPLSYQDVLDQFSLLCDVDKFEVNNYIKYKDIDFLNKYSIKFIDSLNKK